MPRVQSQLDKRLSPHLPQPVNAAFVCCIAGKQISELHCQSVHCIVKKDLSKQIFIQRMFI